MNLQSYVLVVTRTEHRLYDLLDHTGLTSSHRPAYRPVYTPAPFYEAPVVPPFSCLFYASQEKGLAKSRAWIATGFSSDPKHTEERLKDLDGVIAWRRFDPPDESDARKAGYREVFVAASGDRWTDALASLMSKGFAFPRGGLAVLQMREPEIYINGFTALTVEDMKSLEGVLDAGEVRHVDLSKTDSP